MRAPHRRSRWLAIGVVALTCVTTALIGIVAILVVPAVWSAATTVVAARDETVTVRAGEAEARVPVPEGWWSRPVLGDGSRVTIGSPDGGMRVEFALHDGVDAATVIAAAAPGPLQRLDSEPADDGATLLHAHTRAGDALAGGVVAGRAVLVFVSRPSPAYDAQLAALLVETEVVP